MLLLFQQVVVLDAEIVGHNQPQVAFALNVVLARHDSIDQDVDCESVGCKLCADFLVDFHKHVVGALHNRLFTLLFADAVSQPQLVQGNLRDEILKSGRVDALC